MQQSAWTKISLDGKEQTETEHKVIDLREVFVCQMCIFSQDICGEVVILATQKTVSSYTLVLNSTMMSYLAYKHIWQQYFLIK